MKNLNGKAVNSTSTLKNKPVAQYHHHPAGFGPKVNPNNIPQYLKDNCKWCVWKTDEGPKEKKPDGTTKHQKRPYKGKYGISTKEPDKWMSFEDAYHMYTKNVNKKTGKYTFNGIGILLYPNCNIVGVDIDNDLELGSFEELGTYTEYSPSGVGLRVIGKGNTDADLTKPIEIYSGNTPRFLTITGNLVNGSRGIIDIGDIANGIVLENKSAAAIAGDQSTSDVGRYPKPIKFKKQAWWKHNNYKFPKNCPDRSKELFQLTQRYASFKDLTKLRIFSMYLANPDILEMAKSHRNGSKAKAKEYLWADINRAYSELTFKSDEDNRAFADDDIVDFDSVKLDHTDEELKDELDFLDDEFDELPALPDPEHKTTIGQNDSKYISKRERLIKKDEYKGDYDFDNDEDYKKMEKEIFDPWGKHGEEVYVVAPNYGLLRTIYVNNAYNRATKNFISPDRTGYLRYFNSSDFIECVTDFKQILGKLDGQGDKKTFKAFIKKAENTLLSAIKTHRQIHLLNAEIDMFAKKPRMVRNREGLLKIIAPHHPFKEVPYIMENYMDIIHDYTFHFPQFEEFLDFLTDSRFVDNRRNCYIWMHAQSNWGKGFLIEMLNAIGISFTITEDELEKAFSGSPMGISMGDLAKKWVLNIDEFSKVKKETKNLDSTFVGSSKNESRTEVPVYTKLFTSAESVSSLVGNQGVEEQFSNRLNYIKGLHGDIEDMPCWKQYGKSAVFKTIKNYIAIELNKKVKKYQAMGRKEATEQADIAIENFHKKYIITNTYKSLKDSFGGLAEEFVALVNRVVTYGINDESPNDLKNLEKEIKLNGFFVEKGKVGKKIKMIFLKNAGKLMGEFLYVHGGKSEGVKMVYKKDPILKLCAALPINNDSTTVYKLSNNGKTSSRLRARGIFINYIEPGLDDFDCENENEEPVDFDE